MSVSRHKTQCIVCNTNLTGNQTRFCSVKCKSKHNQKNTYQAQQLRAKERKIFFVQLKGGRCEKCSYNKNLAALSFHHVDPSIKKFPLDARNLSNRKLTDIYLEVDKCKLLCLNCHSETHHPDYTL